MNDEVRVPNRAERRAMGFRFPVYAPTEALSGVRGIRRALPHLLDPDRPLHTRRRRKALARIDRIATRYGAK